MTENLDTLITSIHGEGPSAEFVARLRAEVVAEATVAPNDKGVASVDVVPSAHTRIDVAEIELIDPHAQERSGRTRRWTRLGAAAAASAVLVAGAIGLSTNEDTLPVETVALPEQSDSVPIPLTLTAWDTFVPDGTYRVDVLGSSLTFSTTDPLWLNSYGNGMLTLVDVSSPRPEDRRMFVMRPSALSDPANPTIPLQTLDDGWPARDLAGWLENLAPDVIATNRVETTVGGYAAVRIDIALDNSECSSGAFCAYLGTNWLINTIVLDKGSQYRVWMIEQDDLEPIAVIAATSASDIAQEQEWFAAVERVVSTIELGDARPHPLSLSPAGTVQAEMLGGIQMSLGRPAVIEETVLGFHQLHFDAQPTGVTFVMNPFDHEGNALEGSADLLDYLNLGAELIEADGMLVGGYEARVFDLEGGLASWVQLLSSPQSEVGLSVPHQSRVWTIDHPSRGLLVVFAWAEGDDQQALSAIEEEAANLLTSLTFVEEG